MWYRRGAVQGLERAVTRLGEWPTSPVSECVRLCLGVPQSLSGLAASPLMLLSNQMRMQSSGSETSVIPEIESTETTVSLVQSKTGLERRTVLKLVSSVENTGFNAVGQMYRKSHPEALDYGDVRAILEYFEGLRGVQTARLVTNSPFVLGLSRSVLDTFDENRRYVEDMLGLSDDDVGRIVSSNAYVLTRHASATARPCVDHLMKVLGFSKEEVRSIVLRFSRILLLNSSKIGDAHMALQNLMGVASEPSSDFARMVWKFPSVVGLSSSKIKAARDWLAARGVSHDEKLRSVVMRFPQLLSHDLETKMDPIVRYMMDDLRLPHDVVARALTTAPDVFGRKLETIQANVEALRALGLTSIDLTRYLAAFPGGLKIDVSKDPYRSKLEYLEQKLGQKPSTTLPVHPMYLTYSLSRIASRGRFLQSLERSTNGVTAWLSANDEIFAEKFARSTTEDFGLFCAGM